MAHLLQCVFRGGKVQVFDEQGTPGNAFFFFFLLLLFFLLFFLCCCFL